MAHTVSKGASRPVMNLKQKIAVAVVDVLVLAELAYSVYRANMDPENLTPVFFKTFFILLVPTLVLAKIVVKRLRSEEGEIQP